MNVFNELVTGICNLLFLCNNRKSNILEIDDFQFDISVRVLDIDAFHRKELPSQ